MCYYDAGGQHIRPELLNEEAEQAAKKFVQFSNGGVNKKGSIKNSQLRRFFNEFKSLERRLLQARTDQDQEEAFLRIKPLVKMTNAKVVYAHARKVVPQTFVEWLQKNVQAINTVQDFEAFLLHFEAVVGFCYGLNPED